MSRRAKHEYLQKLQDWASLLQVGNEQPNTRLFNIRQVKRVECIVAQIRQDEQLIRQMLEDWEPCFEALCTEASFHTLSMSDQMLC